MANEGGLAKSGAWARTARGAMLLTDDGGLRQTIFAEMTALATASGAINLGQGFPDEDGPAAVLEEARRCILDGQNQYPPGIGVPTLRTAIAEHQQRFYGIALDPDTEVMVTAGATEALTATILALSDEGDEVVTLEPFYDSYAAVIALNRAVHRTVPLRAPHFTVDHDELRAAVTDRTRLILINDPHNPTGTTLDRATLELIVELAHRHDAVIVTDEVYEHLTFDGPHTALASLPGARERTVSISSGGKTFNTTGWKVGWLTAPHDILLSILAVKQYLSYSNAAPLQPAIALGLRLPDEFFASSAAALQRKRDILCAGLSEAGFEVMVPSAGYFAVADCAPFGFDDAAEFCRQLPGLAGVAAVPITSFVLPEHRAGYETLVRFAYCKKDAILHEASKRLSRLTPGG